MMLRVPIDQYWDESSALDDVEAEEVEVREERPRPLDDLLAMTCRGYDGGDTDANGFRQTMVEAADYDDDPQDLVEMFDES